MSDGIRVIVCGGRDYSNSYALYEALDALHGATPFHAVLHGNAAGADTLAAAWARSRNVRCWPHPAQWSKFGNAAGPIRNKQMLGQGVDLVVAFPGGKGTRNMIKQANAAGVKVIEAAVR
jgi:hypothetical protein